jgi:LemA protein
VDSLLIILLLAGVGGLVLLLALWVIFAYNRLVSKRNQVGNAWSQIDVQLKRRHDLIPNLVNTLRGYLEHERGIFERIAEARQRAIAAGDDVAARSQAESELTSTLRSLFAVTEGYPELRSNQNVLHFQEELSSTENRVAFARQFYNDSVLDYNTTCQRFPGALLANRFGFQLANAFELEPMSVERAVPQVQL